MFVMGVRLLYANNNPNSLEGQSLGKYSGGNDTVTDDKDIW